MDAERRRTVSLDASRAFARGTAQLLLLPIRVFAFVVGLVVPPLRAFVGLSFTGVGGGSGRGGEQLTIPETPFQVRDATGDLHDCLLRGELRGGTVRLGDQVEVCGRRSFGSGEIQVSQLTNTVTGTTTTGYVHAKARYNVAMTVVQALAFFLVAYTMLHSCGMV